MTVKSLLLLPAAVAAAFALQGCSALNVGEENFACEGMPGSVYCRSAREVYNVTNTGVVPSPMRPQDAYNEDCDDCVRSEDVNPELRDAEANLVQGTSNVRTTYADESATKSTDKDASLVKVSDDFYKDDEVINNYVNPNLPDKPVPIRTPAQIMRVWIAPYEDEGGNLHAPGYVYTEIMPRRWIYPNDPTTANPRTFAPLAATDSMDTAASAPAPKTTTRTTTHLKRNLPEENSLERFRRAQMSR